MQLKGAWLAVALGWLVPATAQELYIWTEPASNMPARAVGLRLTTLPVVQQQVLRLRTVPEVMWGVNRKLMLHASLPFSNYYTAAPRWEGVSVYGKYRFYSHDALHRHFRLAAFGRLSYNPHPPPYADLVLEGDHSGLSVGVVATQLLHKLALSASLSAVQATDWGRNLPQSPQSGALDFSFSAGYLVLPRSYKNYRQTNFNVYLELLGSTARTLRVPEDTEGGATISLPGGSYVDLAPGVQVIINSRTRVDASWRVQLAGDLPMFTTQRGLLRLEYTLFSQRPSRRVLRAAQVPAG